jgi:SNF2 family DNA or RNA helicase
MYVCHTNWSCGDLCLWAESSASWSEGEPSGASSTGTSVGVADDDGVRAHVYAANEDALRDLLHAAGVSDPIAFLPLELRLPSREGRPTPSPRLAHAVGHSAEEGEGQRLGAFRVSAARIPAARVCAVMDRIEDSLNNGLGERHQAVSDASFEFFAAGVRLVRHLLAQQRFVPGVMQSGRSELAGLWQPWMSDEQTARRVAALAGAMPAVARAVVDEAEHDPWMLLEGFLNDVGDAECRSVLHDETYIDAIEGRDPLEDPHVRWLSSLLGPERATARSGGVRDALPGRVRAWLAGLEDRGESSEWRLMLRLNEPETSETLADFEAPGDDVRWTVSFHLQACDAPELVVDAADVWLFPTDSVTITGRRLDGPHDLLLGELGRASRLYKTLERSLGESQPSEIALTTKEAYHFLREVAPVLAEQGFEVVSPAWWDEPSVRLGAKMYIDSEPLTGGDADGKGGSSEGSVGGWASIGVRSLVDYRWEITLGGATLTLDEFEQLASKGAPLLRIGGNWVEVRPEDVSAAMKFINENPGGSMGLREALSLAYATDVRETGIPVLGIEATGWVGALLGGSEAYVKLPSIEQPASFHGTLRPYQVRGLSWLWFLESLGFGPCLADDMGLGKTIQILALMAYEREAAQEQGGEADSDAGRVGPTLLVVPMSVVGNWIHEARRFCPHLRFVMHHGPERRSGDAFVELANNVDAIVTTYSLVHRDLESLSRVKWRRVVLDEAQFIKNPTTKQSKSVRELESDARVALTGTPVENRLSELWSILDFLNPGYLGTHGSFRKRFSVPIERYRDQERAKRLRGLIQPFVLRRLKSDPKVMVELPEKIESREYTPLTSEQASLYESTVNRLMSEVERKQGIERRGAVLGALVRLKQICNHPAQMLKDLTKGEIPRPGRSGKCIRLVEMMHEVLDSGESSLVFTQFRQMGDILSAMLRHELDREVLFLHGGTPQKERVRIVEQFQKKDGTHPILIASLKAGGIGLNLTAATHVFHFDRWWNPAVENQATDRAYRIGQTRNVHVHKFVVSGTLEERIDEMLERKSELAEQIIGAGEDWLTEMDSDQLRDVLTLRRDVIAEGV